MLRTWKNGEKGSVVQKIIENNFKILGRYLPNHMLSVSREERLSLADEYLCKNLIIYDTTDELWYRYTGSTWEEYKISGSTYSRVFDHSVWNNGKIQIPYSTHMIENPAVQLYMLDGDGIYNDVLGGIHIDQSHNVILNSDFAFAGKVVIK